MKKQKLLFMSDSNTPYVRPEDYVYTTATINKYLEAGWVVGNLWHAYQGGAYVLLEKDDLNNRI